MIAASRLFSVLLVTCPLLLTGCATLGGREPLQVTVAGIEPLQGQGFELRLNVKLRVQNPNDAPVEYNGVTLTMEVQGKNFANGVSDATGTVPRFGDAVIDVPVTVSSARIINHAMSMMMGNASDKIEYEMKGKLANGTFNTTRFSTKGSFDMPVAKDDSF